MNKSYSKIFWGTAFVFIVLNTIVFPMLSKGMFLDGMVYGSISRNMDFSSLWQLNIQSYGESLFYDHPPFLFWIQGVFFNLIGDYFWTEHLYSLSMLFLLLLIIKSFLSHIENYTGNKELLLFGCVLVCAPIIPWSFANNMLENTTIVLTLASSYCVLSALKETKLKLYKAILSIVLLAAAFLTKGPVCLFPLAIPIFYLILFPKNRKSAFQLFTILILGLLIIGSLFYVFENSRMFLSQYLDQQILAALKGERPEIANSRFRILKCLLNNTIIFLMLGVVAILFRKSNYSLFTRKSILYILIGLSGSLPLLLTQKQACIYIMPVIPYFLLAFFPLILFLIDKTTKLTYRLSSSIFLLVIGVCISYFTFQNRQRLPELHKDAITISSLLPEGESLNLDNLCYNYELKAYLSRYKIADGQCSDSGKFIISKDQKPNCRKLADLSVGILYSCDE